LDTTIGAACTNTAGDWQPILAPPQFEDSGYYYLFYRVESGGLTATAQNCAAGFPDGCVDRDTVFDVSGNTLTTSVGDLQELVPGCELQSTTTTTVEDGGGVGTQVIEVSIGYQGLLCVGVENDGCVVTHSFDLEWTRAE
jgi:hypothetical protein